MPGAAALRLERVDADDPAPFAVVLELHASSDLGKDRVVLADTRVHARAKPTSALPNDNRSAAHEVAVVRLDAEALRIRVAPVPGTTLSFFVSHGRA
jgi:hypothetical protein